MAADRSRPDLRPGPRGPAQIPPLQSTRGAIDARLIGFVEIEVDGQRYASTAVIA
jgi:hypothetical protein